MTKIDWQAAALNQRNIALTAERRGEIWRHAMNLYINDAIVWFYEYRTMDDGVHKIGVGVARGVPVTSEFSPESTEDIPVVLWLTSWPEPHKYVTACGLDEFRSLPKQHLGGPKRDTVEETSPPRFGRLPRRLWGASTRC
jgi:hypothetical protein